MGITNLTEAILEAGAVSSQPWLDAPVALVYKHSPICGVSSSAMREVRSFSDAHRDVPVWVVDVIRQRALSERVASTLGVRHASPQVLLVAQGRVVFADSHFRITRAALEDALREAVVGEPSDLPELSSH